MTVAFGPGRCLYMILLPGTRERGNGIDEETAFAHLDRNLVNAQEPLRVIASLPIEIEQLFEPDLGLKVPPSLVPHHAVIFAFEDSPDSAEMLERFPFAALFDFRNGVGLPPQRPGHVHVSVGDKDAAAFILERWAQESRAAIDRVRPFWPPGLLTRIDAHVNEFENGQLPPEKAPMLPLDQQLCLHPNGHLRNLSAGQWGSRVRVGGGEFVPPSDTNAIRARQIMLADEVLSLARPRVGKPTANLVVPAVNPSYTKGMAAALAAGGLPREFVSLIVQAEGYHYPFEPAPGLRGEQLQGLAALLSERQQELNVVDAVATLMAAHRGDVVFRTPHVPGRSFDDMHDLAAMNWDHGKIPKTVERWTRYGASLARQLGEPLLEWLISNAGAVRAFSDLPVEWAMVKGAPLHFHIPVHRIPLAPGNTPVRALADLRPPVVWSTASDVRVLIALAHKAEDPIMAVWTPVEQMARELGFPVVVVTVHDEQQLVDAVNTHKPRLLLLSSHGNVDKTGAHLALPGGNSSVRLKLSHAPDAALVSACRSDPVTRTYGSPASNLFFAGTRAILASYLILTEPHAATVAVRLLANLSAALSGELNTSTWRDLVWWTLRSSRPVDVLSAAERYARSQRTAPGNVMELFVRFTHEHRSNPELLDWTRTPERLLEMARGTPFANAVTSVVARCLFRPESMFYTQLGEPERILLGPRWDRLIVRSGPSSADGDLERERDSEAAVA